MPMSNPPTAVESSVRAAGIWTGLGLAAVLCLGLTAKMTASAAPADLHGSGRALAGDAALIDLAMQRIEPFEGRRHRVYRDTRGHHTVGVGFNLDRPGAAADLAQLVPGLSFRALRAGRVALTDGQIDAILRHDVARALVVARREVTGFDRLPLEARLIVVDMAFNLGSLRAWRDLRGALRRGDYAAAAEAMHDSRWRHQVGRRAETLIGKMRRLAER